MIIKADTRLIPGTVITRSSSGGVTGTDFLDRIFFVSDGIMLAQIRDICGIDGTTLQNWTKRGWVDNPKSKKYTKDQLARILIINMLRDCMRLDSIVFVISYINGRVYDRSDSILTESVLYGYICRVLDEIDGYGNGLSCGQNLRDCIAFTTADYEESIKGTAARLRRALEIIITAYGASLEKKRADEMVNAVMRF